MMVELFPAIDLHGGQVVRLTQGDYGSAIVYGNDPVAVGALVRRCRCDVDPRRRPRRRPVRLAGEPSGRRRDRRRGRRACARADRRRRAHGRRRPSSWPTPAWPGW